MLPHVKLVSAGHAVGAAFARALPVAHGIDVARPGETLSDCMRFADYGFLLQIAGENPLSWRFHAHRGLNRLKGVVAQAAPQVGDLPDPVFTSKVLVPTYVEAIAAAQPVVHRVAAVTNDTFVAYCKLTVPIYAAPDTRQVSHIVNLTQLHLVLSQFRSRTAGLSTVTYRQRQCLALAASGLAGKEIAAEIGCSEKTVELHLARARHMLGARTTPQAISITAAIAMMDG